MCSCEYYQILKNSYRTPLVAASNSYKVPLCHLGIRPACKLNLLYLPV